MSDLKNRERVRIYVRDHEGKTGCTREDVAAALELTEDEVDKAIAEITVFTERDSEAGLDMSDLAERLTFRIDDNARIWVTRRGRWVG